MKGIVCMPSRSQESCKLVPCYSSVFTNYTIYLSFSRIKLAKGNSDFVWFLFVVAERAVMGPHDMQFDKPDLCKGLGDWRKKIYIPLWKQYLGSFRQKNREPGDTTFWIETHVYLTKQNVTLFK